ncbi:membrane protein [Bacilli bacterium]|nr:membrane protein [Bacilli bacterium]
MTKDIFLILGSVVLNAMAQLLMRGGMIRIGNVTTATSLIKAIPKMLTNWQLWLAISSYGISTIIWMMALSKFEVSFAYTFSALGFVLVALCGYFFFHEQIGILRLVGIGFICVGVLLIAKS